MDTSISNRFSASSADPKTAVMSQIRQEAAVSNARQLIEKLNDNCFEKCVPTPGLSLSRKEESCFTMCMEKYMAAWNTVSRQYVARIQKESGGAAGTGDQGSFL